MDRDEYDFVRSDWDTYHDPPDGDRCIYCGEELGPFNMVYYAINKDYDQITLAINPKPHDKIVVPKGYKKRYEIVCDMCLKEEFNA